MANMFRQSISDKSAKAYKNMICALKVAQQDAQVLHRHLQSAEFLAVHEFLGDIYKDWAEWVDTLAEIGISIGIKEPCIATAVAYTRPITVEPRDSMETMSELCSICAFLFEEMDNVVGCIDVPDDIKSKIQEYQLELRETAMYKAKRIIDYLSQIF